MRGVRELPELPRHHKRDLLTDVNGVVADALDRPGHEHHRHRPLAPILVRSDLDRARKHAAIQAIDLRVLAHKVLGHGDVAQQERLLALLDL